jgi:sugar phosphate isomerase/epimerase
MERGREEECKRLVRNVILLAEKMGVKVAAGFAGRIPDEPLEKSLPGFKKIWTEHAKFAQDHDVKIAFENWPGGRYSTPCGGVNMMCTPDIWEKAFNEVNDKTLGLQWDPGHLICLFVDPVENLRKFGSRVYAVHAKDAKVHWDRVRKFGIWYDGAIEPCFPGFGDTDWASVIRELVRHGYYGNLDIEGRHDAVFCDHQHGLKIEDAGLLITLKYLSQFVADPTIGPGSK